MSTKRFRIAFSFAGEKRDFVSKVADILAQQFKQEKILYDRYHRAEFSRSDLAFYLPDLYEKEADLVVAVFCPDYDTKEWCGLEWNSIFGLLKARKVGEVMLTRFERVEGKGLHGLAGYTDLDDLTPEQAATLILERLAINEGRPRDHYTKPTLTTGTIPKTSIPNNLPRLQPFFGFLLVLALVLAIWGVGKLHWAEKINITPTEKNIPLSGDEFTFPLSIQNQTKKQIDNVGLLIKITPMLLHPAFELKPESPRETRRFGDTIVDEQGFSFRWDEDNSTFIFQDIGTLYGREVIKYQALVRLESLSTNLQVRSKYVNTKEYLRQQCEKFPEKVRSLFTRWCKEALIEKP